MYQPKEEKSGLTLANSGSRKGVSTGRRSIMMMMAQNLANRDAVARGEGSSSKARGDQKRSGQLHCVCSLLILYRNEKM
jgi:hypothetical protein